MTPKFSSTTELAEALSELTQHSYHPSTASAAAEVYMILNRNKQHLLLSFLASADLIENPLHDRPAHLRVFENEQFRAIFNAVYPTEIYLTFETR